MSLTPSILPGQNHERLHIDLLFETNEDGYFTPKSLLYQDIMEYFLEDNKEHPFRFTDLAKWLMKKNNEFRNYYSGSKAKVPMSSRTANRRQKIKQCIDDLIGLDLISDQGKTKSQKNETLTPLYAYTIQGQILSFLLLYYKNSQEEKDTSEKAAKRKYACEKIYDLIQKYLTDRESYDATFALKFFTNLLNGHIFETIVIELIAGLIGDGIAGKYSFNSVFQLLNYIMYIVFTPH